MMAKTNLKFFIKTIFEKCVFYYRLWAQSFPTFGLQIEAENMYYINNIKLSMDQAEIISFVPSFAQAMQLEQSQ